MSDKPRLYYLDNLRVMLTILVIAHHVGQAYGPTGGYWPVQEEARAALLAPFFTVNRSFFMSLFFMVSGFFLAGAYERSSPLAFVLGRLRRLGIPVLVFAALMLPARIFLFGEEIARWQDVFNAAHLWYLEHLLLFSLLYALWRRIRGNRPLEDLSMRPLPRWPAYLAFALAVAVGSALVRIWSPIDRWFNLLGFFRVAFADVPRDLAFFLVGVLAWRRAWFERFPARAGWAWLAVGLAAAAAWYSYALGLGRYLPMSDTAFGVVYPLWESLLCLGMCIGLTVAFREAANSQGALARDCGALGKWLADNQYSAYFWHPLLIVALQMTALALPLGPLAKFALVTIVGVAVVFAWSWLFRRLAPVRAVL
jgi:fucose 4-O-acetylase-like acetyltransferase